MGDVAPNGAILLPPKENLMAESILRAYRAVSSFFETPEIHSFTVGTFMGGRPFVSFSLQNGRSIVLELPDRTTGWEGVGQAEIIEALGRASRQQYAQA